MYLYTPFDLESRARYRWLLGVIVTLGVSVRHWMVIKCRRLVFELPYMLMNHTFIGFDCEILYSCLFTEPHPEILSES